MLKNPPMSQNYSNSARKPKPNFLQSDVENYLPVITNALFQFLMPTLAKAFTRFKGQVIFHVGSDRFFPPQ